MPQLNPIAGLESSLLALAQVGLRKTDATGYALFLQTPEPPGLLRLSSLGDTVSPEALLDRQSTGALQVFALHTAGVLDGFVAFAFRSEAASSWGEKPLRRLVEAIEAIWLARNLDAQCRELAVRASSLQTTLFDSRIADRAQGLLANDPQADVIETLVLHVKNVLRPSALIGTIKTLVEELEGEIEERRVTAEAKAILQAAHSFSEEQAYTHLRALSRKSRRRLKDVALDVIGGRVLKASAA